MGRFVYVVLFVACVFQGFSQKFSAQLVDEQNNPIAYANVGVLYKNIGSVSTINGDFSIDLSNASATDTIKISCIGYASKYIVVQNVKALDKQIVIKSKAVEIAEVVIKPVKTKEKVFGVETTSSFMSIGFSENQLGKEVGLLMRNNKVAHLKELRINFSSCAYDSIFYRVNIYNFKKGESFENVMPVAVYLSLQKEQTEKTVVVDVSKYGIVVEGDFLVALEHITDLGLGGLYFCGSLSGKSYFRNTSQGTWGSVPFGVSISAKALVEK